MPILHSSRVENLSWGLILIAAILCGIIFSPVACNAVIDVPPDGRGIFGIQSKAR